MEGVDADHAHRVEQVDSAEAIAFACRQAKKQGLLVGISCGAAEGVAARFAQQATFEGKTIVIVLADAGERHLSTVLFERIGV